MAFVDSLRLFSREMVDDTKLMKLLVKKNNAANLLKAAEKGERRLTIELRKIDGRIVQAEKAGKDNVAAELKQRKEKVLMALAKELEEERIALENINEEIKLARAIAGHDLTVTDEDKKLLMRAWNRHNVS